MDGSLDYKNKLMGRPKKIPQIDPRNILPRQISPEKIPDAWHYIMNELLSYNLNFLERQSKLLNEARFKLLVLRVKSWEIALHWLIRPLAKKFCGILES